MLQELGVFPRAMVKAYLLVFALFLMLPSVFMAALNPAAIPEAIAFQVVFLAAALISGSVLCGWAGRSLPESQVPAYLMGQISLVFGAVSTMLVGSMASTSASLTVIDSHDIELAGLYLGVFWFFGALPAFFASSLFIGHVASRAGVNAESNLSK